MSEVKFQRADPGFSRLVTKTQQAIRNDQKISSEELAALTSVAEEDGLFSLAESNFLLAAQDSRNHQTLLSMGSAQGELSLFIDEDDSDYVPERPYQSKQLTPDFMDSVSMYWKSLFGDSDELSNTKDNPLGAVVSDPGKNFDLIMDDSSITTTRIKENIKQHPMASQLSQSLDSLLAHDLIKENKEALTYINHMFHNRQPQLSHCDLEQILPRLETMANTDFDHRIGNQHNFITSAIHDIAVPDDISQENKNTCVATSLLIKMVSEKPLDYLNMLNSLAQNTPYQTHCGEKMQPNWSFVDEVKGDRQESYHSGRSIASKIAQNAIMGFARPGYDSANEDVGMTIIDQKKPQTSIFGDNLTSLAAHKYNFDEMMPLIDQFNPSRDKPLPISMTFARSSDSSFPHAVNLIGLDKEAGTAEIINPWGRVESVDFDNLKERMMAINLNEEYFNDEYSVFKILHKVD